jgi:cyanophycin synthetase
VLEKGMNGDLITVYDNGAHIPVLWSHLIPATMEGKAMHNVQNAMFATAMAYSFRVDLDNIRHGLRTFDTSFFQAPGRTNVFDEHPFKVILDYAHNPAAFRAIADLVDRLEVKGRRIAVVAAPGDRRDEDIAEAAGILAGHFDYYICKADDNRRGRGQDEVPTMMRTVLVDSGVDPDAVILIPDEAEAVEHALNMAQEGDLLTVFGDNSARCWKQIIYFKHDGRPDAGPSPSPAALIPVESGEYIGEGEALIRDERGVRLARHLPEDSD